MMEDVTQRAGRIIAFSALLGLPAAVLAHAGIFGDSHVLGGTGHTLFGALWMVLAGLAAGSALTFAFLNARAESTRAAVIARIGAFAPSLATLIASTSAWFVLIELRERPHAIPILPVAAALCLAAWIIGAAWRGLARVAAEIAFDLVQKLRVASELGAFGGIGFTVPAIAARASTYRLFSRPPPA